MIVAPVLVCEANYLNITSVGYSQYCCQHEPCIKSQVVPEAAAVVDLQRDAEGSGATDDPIIIIDSDSEEEEERREEEEKEEGEEEEETEEEEEEEFFVKVDLSDEEVSV